MTSINLVLKFNSLDLIGGRCHGIFDSTLSALGAGSFPEQ